MSDKNENRNETTNVTEGNEEHVYHIEDIQTPEGFDKMFFDEDAVLVL